MKTPDPDLSQVKRLLELVDDHGLEELSVEEGDLQITVRGTSSQAPAHHLHAPSPPAIEAAVEAAAEAIAAEPSVPAEEMPANTVEIVAPLVGVFYRAPSPDADPFVEVGDEIDVGSEVGLIEAMKVFSPIPSEVAGIVVAIPGQNGKLVHEGEVLVRVQVNEGAAG